MGAKCCVEEGIGRQCCAEDGKSGENGEVVTRPMHQFSPVFAADDDIAEGDDPKEAQAANNKPGRRRAQTFAVHIPDRAGRKLGIDTTATVLSPVTFSVVKVKSGGLLDDWNRDNPGFEVRATDEIVEVNGVRGDRDRMCALLARAPELNLQIECNN